MGDEINEYTREQALSLFTSFLLTDKHFVYAKFGDGELACMNGEKGHNCDSHPYSEKLGDLLTSAFIGLNKMDDVYIANWQDDGYSEIRDFFIKNCDLNPKLVYYDTMLHVQNQLDEHIYNFLKFIKLSTKRKIFFGPLRLNPVEKLLNINIHIEVPLVNNFKYYDKYVTWLSNNIKKDDIIIFSSGMMSKSLIYEIRQLEMNTTCIDMGSSFDPIFVGKTRLKQLDKIECEKFYKDLMK